MPLNKFQLKNLLQRYTLILMLFINIISLKLQSIFKVHLNSQTNNSYKVT
jgi:hypothetical protein